MTPAGAPTVFIIDDDAGVRALKGTYKCFVALILSRGYCF